MKPMRLADVRKHTGRHLTYAEAVKLANPSDPFLRNMAIALSLHTWNKPLPLPDRLQLGRAAAAPDRPTRG